MTFLSGFLPKNQAGKKILTSCDLPCRGGMLTQIRSLSPRSIAMSMSASILWCLPTIKSGIMSLQKAIRSSYAALFSLRVLSSPASFSSSAISSGEKWSRLSSICWISASEKSKAISFIRFCLNTKFRVYIYRFCVHKLRIHYVFLWVYEPRQLRTQAFAQFVGGFVGNCDFSLVCKQSNV